MKSLVQTEGSKTVFARRPSATGLGGVVYFGVIQPGCAGDAYRKPTRRPPSANFAAAPCTCVRAHHVLPREDPWNPPRKQLVMKPFTLLSLFCLCLFVACVDDDDLVRPDNVELRVDFAAQYDENALGIQRETYDYPTGATLKATLFQYYVSDLALIDTDGNAVGLSDIELIRYNSAADPGVVSRTFTVPEGDYVAVRFGLGVKPALNAQPPSNFSAADPLNEAEFWNENARYVFAKWEANADLDGDGTFEQGLSYHLGADALYRTLRFDGPTFTLDGSGDPRVVVVADYLRALSDGTDAGTFDIATVSRIHGSNQAASGEMWDRFADQFTVRIEQ